MSKTSLNVAEIRTILKEQYGYSDDAISKLKGVRELRDELKLLRETDTDFEETEMIENNNEVQININYLDPGWTDFILSQLRDDEKKDGYPVAAGLRRMVETYIGHIEKSTTVEVRMFGDSIVVQHEIKVDNQLAGTEYFSRNAEANNINTPYPYNKYIVSVAESRAESRCLRAILRLNVVTAEEIGAELLNKGDSFDFTLEPINDSQLSVINTLALRHDININELIKMIFGSKPKKLTRQHGAEIIEKLNEYGHDEQIPDMLVGFNENWTKL